MGGTQGVRVRRKLPAIRCNDPKAHITGSEITKIHQEPHPSIRGEKETKTCRPNWRYNKWSQGET
jgi:hypothetical protein